MLHGWPTPTEQQAAGGTSRRRPHLDTMKYSLKNSPKTAFFREERGLNFFAGLPPRTPVRTHTPVSRYSSPTPRGDAHADVPDPRREPWPVRSRTGDEGKKSITAVSSDAPAYPYPIAKDLCACENHGENMLRYMYMMMLMKHARPGRSHECQLTHRGLLGEHMQKHVPAQERGRHGTREVAGPRWKADGIRSGHCVRGGARRRRQPCGRTRRSRALSPPACIVATRACISERAAARWPVALRSCCSRATRRAGTAPRRSAASTLASRAATRRARRTSSSSGRSRAS